MTAQLPVEILVTCGAAYNLLAIAGAARFRFRKAPITSFRPAVSILKPVKGRDLGFYEAIRSHAAQDYPEFEILFGVADMSDAAVPDIQRLQREFPQRSIRILTTPTDAPNRKAGSLEILAREAKHAVLLVNDGDITVPPGYLRHVLGYLEDEGVGLVTCLYRGRGESGPAAAEALGIGTEFAPSVLVARLLSSTGFALGSTMAFRRRELEAIGGFASIREYLADDYQLGARISALSKRIEMAEMVVETSLGAGSLADVWRHQVRWSRTIRISRPGGYLGYVVTHATFWCLVAAALGAWPIALGSFAIRMAAAASALGALGAPQAALPLVPLRDLAGFAVWCAGLFGNTVEWRTDRFRLLRDGRMVRLSSRD
ncbi:MAG: glycosyltransferase [Acidobacteriia bacterium]|nr:glycosyltransferase [Terriglobia bacterium]